MIFVCVGSRNYQFNRLFIKLDELIERDIIKEPVFAQIGVSSYIPKYYQYKDFLDKNEYIKKIDEADIVITHGGTGSIMQALKAGKKVITATRLEKYGEHINDHQIQNNKAFEINGYVLAVYEMDKLGEALEKIYNGCDNLKPWKNDDPMAVVNIIDEFIQKSWSAK